MSFLGTQNSRVDISSPGAACSVMDIAEIENDCERRQQDLYLNEKQHSQDFNMNNSFAYVNDIFQDKR